MGNNKQATTARQIKSITYLGMVMNIALSVIKIAIGLFAASLALVADGIHSLSDVATDVAVLLGLRLGSKEPDQSHPYGHGRAETFSAGLVALILIVVGGAMVYYATLAIARDEMTTPCLGVLIAAVISIAVKEWLYKATQKVAIQSHSPALYANAWHHRSDAVGLMIIWVGIRVVGDALRELAEAAVDPDTIEQIKSIINSDSSIRQWHKLRTRTVGREVFLDLHILVDPDLKITAAHEIAEKLEKTLDEQITRPINITVHIEPDTPELRK